MPDWELLSSLIVDSSDKDKVTILICFDHDRSLRKS